MSVLMWSAIVTAVIVGHFYGGKAAAGAALAVVVAEIAFAYMAVKREKSRRIPDASATVIASGPPVETPVRTLVETSATVASPEPETPYVPRDRTRRATDVVLPVDDLPWNRSFDEKTMVEPARYGNDFAFFEVMEFFEARDIEPSFRPQLYRKVYSELKRALGGKIEIEARQAVSDAWLAMHAAGELIAFRSRDAVLAGFQCDGEMFQFRRSALLAFELHVWLPARSQGFFELSFYIEPPANVLPVRYRHDASIDLGIHYSDKLSFEVLTTLNKLSLLFDLRFQVQAASDV